MALAAAAIGIAGTLAFPAVAVAQPTTEGGVGLYQTWGGPGYSGDGQVAPGDWSHPEWGAGWNNGYPQQGWTPPQGWAPPTDWTNPTGWQPPPGWCGGPFRDLIHLRCWVRPA